MRRDGASALAREGRWLIAVVGLGALVFGGLPVARLLAAALFRGDALDLGGLTTLATPSALLALRHSLETSVLSSLGAVTLGGSAALALGLLRLPGRRSFSFLFVLSMMVAPQVTALAFLSATGPSSPILATFGLAPPPGTPNALRSAGGIIALMALHHAPLAFVTITAGLKRIPLEVAEAAEVEGADRWTLLGAVVLPLLRGHLVAASLVTFVAALGNFGIPALLGTSVGYFTLPTLIYRRLSSLGPTVIGDIAALSVPLVALSIAALIGARALTGAETRLAPERNVIGLWPAGRWTAPLVALFAAVIVLSLVVPLASLATAALVPTYGVPLGLTTLTLDNFVEVIGRQAVTGRAFRNSALLSAAAATLTSLAALAVAFCLTRQMPKLRGLVEGLFELNYAIPGILVAVVTILMLLPPLPVLRISLYGTPFIILFAYLARFFAVALTPLLVALGGMDSSIEEAAALCGAGFLRRLVSILAPAVAPAMLAGGLLVFLLAFNELTVSALLWSNGSETIGVVTYSLEEAGFTSTAAALALLAVAVVALAMLALDRMARHLPSGALPWR